MGDDEEEFDQVGILMQKNNRTKMRIRIIIVFVRMRMEWMMKIVMMIMIRMIRTVCGSTRDNDY